MAMRANPLRFVDPSGNASIGIDRPKDQELEEFLEEIKRALEGRWEPPPPPPAYPKECLPEDVEFETEKGYPLPEEIVHGGIKKILDDIKKEAEEKCRKHCRTLHCFNWGGTDMPPCYFCISVGTAALRLIGRVPPQEVEGIQIPHFGRGGARKVEDFGDASQKAFVGYYYTVRCLCECQLFDYRGFY